MPMMDHTSAKHARHDKCCNGWRSSPCITDRRRDALMRDPAAKVHLGAATEPRAACISFGKKPAITSRRLQKMSVMPKENNDAFVVGNRR